MECRGPTVPVSESSRIRLAFVYSGTNMESRVSVGGLDVLRTEIEGSRQSINVGPLLPDKGGAVSTE